jgi:6-phosphogluconolactonase
MTVQMLFVGTYTDPNIQATYPVTPERPLMGMPGPTGSIGIYAYAQDTVTGAWSLQYTLPGANPAFVALDPDARRLFAVSEARFTDGEPEGSVVSYALAGRGEQPILLNRQLSGGRNPCQLSVSPDGETLIVANHEHGRVAVFPVAADGRLGPATDVQVEEPTDPTGVRGSHTHCVTFDPTGHWVLSMNTGTDRVTVYRFDRQNKRLMPNDRPAVEIPGAGPRHFVFHPNGRFGYTNGELDMSLSVMTWDGQKGTMSLIQSVATIPNGISMEAIAANPFGRLRSSHIAIHPNGRLLYVSSRGYDSIAVFTVDPATGRVELKRNEPTRGATPRGFAIAPNGSYLYVANQNSASVDCFKIDRETGGLDYAGRVAELPAPASIVFAPQAA